MLLFTRHAILEKAGFQVFSTSDLKEVETIATKHRIDLLVLCQTVAADERPMALAIVHTFNPNATAFALAEILSPYSGEAVPHNSGNFAIAKNFLTSVEEVIQQHQSSSPD
jgi:hypothetical protein